MHFTSDGSSAVAMRDRKPQPISHNFKTFFVAVTLIMANEAATLEEPSYEVIDQTTSYEIRIYEPYLVAETIVTGDFDDTGNVGFRRLAGYIFGENTSRDATDSNRKSAVKMNMTAPVTRHRPQDHSSNVTVYRFVMESAYDRDSLPIPKNSEVKIEEVKGGKFAVRQYRGRISEARFDKQVAELRAALERDNIKTIGEPLSAVYNGPWTPPFMRRNEVILRVNPNPTQSGE